VRQVSMMNLRLLVFMFGSIPSCEAFVVW